MVAARTQVYLTREQRERIAELMRRDNVSLAAIVRDALDAYLVAHIPDRERALAATFGALPKLSVPARDEWQRG